MNTGPHALKGYGYLISIVSVFLLAYPPLKSAKGDPLVIGGVVVGALLSILGMALRWIADRKTQHKIDRAQDKSDAALAENGRSARNVDNRAAGTT